MRQFYFILFLMFSCKSPQQISSNNQTPKQSNTPKQPKEQTAAASNHAKITATVIFIDETRDSSDVQSPCYKAPCYADIRIEKIERKGSLFQTPENTDVRVFFVPTLSTTTEEIFGNNVGVYYPGLKINDKFEAAIESRMGLNNQVNYTIYGYRKLE